LFFCLFTFSSAPPPFRCGVCASVFSVPPDGFQKLVTVFFVDNIVSSASGGQNVADPNNVKCQICDEELAITHCPECPSFLCGQCAVFHGRLPASKHHQTTSVDEALSGTAPAKRISRCLKHPVMEIDTFCKTCDVTVCSKCVTEAHSSHTFRPVSQEVERLKDEIVTSLAVMSLREKDAKAGIISFSGSLPSLDRNSKAAEEEIHSTFRALQADLDARKEQLLGGLEEKKRVIKKTTELEKEETEFAYSELKGFREFTEVLLVEGTPVEIATSHPAVCVFPFLFFFCYLKTFFLVFLVLLLFFV